MVQKKLIEKYGNVINHMSCVYINEGEKHLRALVEEIKPQRRTCVEIGTYQGVSACILAEYFERVLTIDIAKQKLTDEIIGYLGMSQKVDARIVKTDAEKIELINREFDTGAVDMVFIDGGHSKSQLDLDWKSTCTRATAVLIHDYEQHFKDVFDYVNAIEGWEKRFSGLFALLMRPADGPYKKSINMIGKKPIKKNAI